MAISTDQKYKLNNFMGPVAKEVALGDLIEGAESVVAGEIALANGSILIGNGSGIAAANAVSGDITLSNTGVAAIAASAIVNADVNASAAIAFSKLASLTDGQILVGNGSNVAAAVAVTGDVTISNAGVTAIGANKVLNAMVDPTVVKYVDVTISTAEVLALRTTPKELVAAPGAGFCIVPLSVYATVDFNTTAYDNGTDTLDIIYAGGSAIISFATTLVEAAADIRNYMEKSEATFVPLDNTALQARTSSADPTLGDSAIKIRVWYKIVPLLL
jgi:hypothetical protein